MPYDLTKVASQTVQLNESDYDDRRDAQRRSVLWRAILHVHEYQYNCHIKNFSMTGVKLKFNLSIQIGQIVHLEITRYNVTIKAEVVYSHNGHIGLRFMGHQSIIQEVFADYAASMGIN